MLQIRFSNSVNIIKKGKLLIDEDKKAEKKYRKKRKQKLQY